jgi:hypothetical protein
MFPPVDPTRRRLLTIAAAASIAGVSPAIASALPDDPIYAAIERHRAACEAHREAVRVEFAFEEVGMTGEKLRQYQILQVATSAAFDDMDDVGCDLVNTKPTTLAGIVALCRYVEPLLNEEGTPQMPEIVAWEDDTESSVAGALANVIAAAVRTMIDAQAGKAVQS